MLIKRISMLIASTSLVLLSSTSAFSADSSWLEKVYAEKVGVSQKEAKKVVADVFNSLATTLDDGKTVTVRGFGKFYVSNRDKREARHPKTGKTIQVPARKYARFSSSDTLKNKLNQ